MTNRVDRGATVTLLTILVFVLLAVVIAGGRTVIRSVHRAEELLTARQVEMPLPFPAEALIAQQVAIRKAQAKATQLADAWKERWGGKTLGSTGEQAECMREERESTYEYRLAECEERLFCEMVRANARVQLGAELLYEARTRVSQESHHRRIAEIMRSARAGEEGRFLSEAIQHNADEGRPIPPAHDSVESQDMR
jgi:hypothetical protein